MLNLYKGGNVPEGRWANGRADGRELNAPEARLWPTESHGPPGPDSRAGTRVGHLSHSSALKYVSGRPRKGSTRSRYNLTGRFTA